MVGLSFLNKKKWHTGSFQNIEKVWLAEQKEKEKRKRWLEHNKKLKEERQIEDLKKCQVEAGIIPRSHLDRMDWMYSTGASKMATVEDVLGAEQKVEEDDSKKKQRPAIFQESTVNKEHEEFVKLHEDPLVKIMEQEQKSRKNILDNPAKMREIMEEIKRLKEGKKKEEDAEKKHKHHHHHHKRDRHDSDSSEEEKDEKGRNKRRNRSRERSRSPKEKEELGPPKEMMNLAKRKEELDALRRKQDISYDHLSESEKAKILEEMKVKQKPVKSAEKESEEPEKKGDKAKFIAETKNTLYMKDSVSLEERVKRNAHYNMPLRQLNDKDE